jgi:glycosyltransferase involved in cell wall biosynthesis
VIDHHGPVRRGHICFYAAVKDRELFELVEFYRQDIEALEELGYTVSTVNSPWHLGQATDAYWVWWPTSGLPAVLVAAARRKPCVLVSAQSDRDQTATGLARRSLLARLALRVSLRLANITVATSDDTRQGLTRFRSRSLVSLPLAVDTSVYRPADDGAGPERPYVLTISHLTAENIERKRILDVVKIAALTREAAPGLTFVLAGGHEDAKELVEREIEALGVADRVSLVGRVSFEQKLDLLRGAAIYLQPTHYEGFGMAIAEAMACATPVLTNAVGNVPSLVADAAYVLDANCRVQDLAKALVEAMEDPGSREAVGRRGRQRIEQRFSSASRRARVAEALARAGG